MALKWIDISKGNKSNHPDLKLDGTQYLIKWGENYVAGRFRSVWFGLTFHPFWGASSIQFDAPGYNCSEWEAIWEIVND